MGNGADYTGWPAGTGSIACLPVPALSDVRAKCEADTQESGLKATILRRPWYMLGPGHRWPFALIPAYWLLECLPATRDGARRLGLVTLEQMLQTLTKAVASPAPNVRILGVPWIRRGNTPTS